MKLYPAVGEDEYAQLMKTGTFQIVEQSVEGKYFAESIKHAVQWGNILFGLRQFRIVEVELPTTLANNFYRWERLDNIGPARYAEIDKLVSADVRIREVER